MNLHSKIVKILKNILMDFENRNELILEFQNLVWDTKSSELTKEEYEFLHLVTWELDFYQPTVKEPKPKPGYLSDEEVDRIVQNALEGLLTMGFYKEGE